MPLANALRDALGSSSGIAHVAGNGRTRGHAQWLRDVGHHRHAVSASDRVCYAERFRDLRRRWHACDAGHAVQLRHRRADRVLIALRALRQCETRSPSKRFWVVGGGGWWWGTFIFC